MGDLFGGGSGSPESAQAGTSNAALNQITGQVGGDTSQVWGNFINSILPTLTNFGSSQQPEIQQLGNTLNNANTSAVKTYEQQAGGVANPALLFRDLNTSNAQSGATATQGMQSQLSGQILQALGLGSQAATSSLGDLAGIGSTNAQAGVASAQQATNQQNSLTGKLFG